MVKTLNTFQCFKQKSETQSEALEKSLKQKWNLNIKLALAAFHVYPVLMCQRILFTFRGG